MTRLTTHYPRTTKFGAINFTAWNFIKDQIILAEKCRGRATLAHKARLVEQLPDWNLGLTKITYLMLPPSQREEYFTLISCQAQDDPCEKVSAIHMETMMRCLASEESKHLFPLLRNCKVKLACSRAAAHGKCVYENIAKHKATTAAMEDALIAPLPHQEFHWVTHRPRNRSRSPLRGSHTQKPRPRVHVARPAWPARRSPPTWSQWIPTTTTSTEAANVPLELHMRRLPNGDPTTTPPDKPTTGVPNNQPPTTGTPSNQPPTVPPHHRSSRPESSRVSEPSFIGQIAPLSFQAAIPHKPRQVRWGELHASVVTEWSPACLHK